MKEGKTMKSEKLKQIALLSTAGIALLSPDQIALLSPDQIARLSPALNF